MTSWSFLVNDRSCRWLHGVPPGRSVAARRGHWFAVQLSCFFGQGWHGWQSGLKKVLKNAVVHQKRHHFHGFYHPESRCMAWGIPPILLYGYGIMFIITPSHSWLMMVHGTMALGLLALPWFKTFLKPKILCWLWFWDLETAQKNPNAWLIPSWFRCAQWICAHQPSSSVGLARNLVPETRWLPAEAVALSCPRGKSTRNGHVQWVQWPC